MCVCGVLFDKCFVFEGLRNSSRWHGDWYNRNNAYLAQTVNFAVRVKIGLLHVASCVSQLIWPQKWGILIGYYSTILKQLNLLLVTEDFFFQVGFEQLRPHGRLLYVGLAHLLHPSSTFKMYCIPVSTDPHPSCKCGYVDRNAWFIEGHSPEANIRGRICGLERGGLSKINLEGLCVIESTLMTALEVKV